MNRQQRRAAGRAGRVTFASLPGWREASAEALRRWAGLFDAADVEALRATMSAREIATRAGVSDDTINKLLRGKGLKADSIKKLLSVPVEGGAQ